MIDQFIQQATQQLGISSDQAKSATGGVLGMIKQHAPAGDFSQLLSKVPGAEQLVNQFGNQAAGGAPGGAGGGGGLGGLMSMASGLLGGGKSSGGGGLGDVAGLMGMLSSNGLSADKGMNFASMLLGFLKQQGGSDLLGSVLKNVPGLSSMLK
jgi:hypothetical protein